MKMSKHSEVYLTSAIWPKVRLLPQGYRAALPGSALWCCQAEGPGGDIRAADPRFEHFGQETEPLEVEGLHHRGLGGDRACSLLRGLPGGDWIGCGRWQLWRKW